MAKNELIFLTKEGKTGTLPTNTTTGTTPIFTAGADGAKILNISFNTDEVDCDLRIGGVLIFSIVPYVKGQNLLEILGFPTDKNGNHYLNLPPNETIGVATNNANIGFVYGEDY
jgi:hypothetical protein